MSGGGCGSEELYEPLGQARVVFHFAFPYHHHFPTKSGQCFQILPVPLLISFKFRPPIRVIAFRRPSLSACQVLMPKTSVNEYGLPSSSNNNVRFAGNVFTMESVAIAQAVQQA